MKNKQPLKGGDTVLDCKKGGKSFSVTPDSFGSVDFNGVEVSGEAYYIAKAVEAGAIKPRKKKAD